jgi:hypothetical protein
MCILLTYMTAMTCFKANRRRIEAAVDERLMRGFREQISPITAAPLLPYALSAESLAQQDEIRWRSQATVFPWADGKGLYSRHLLYLYPQKTSSPKTSPARWGENILGISGGSSVPPGSRPGDLVIGSIRSRVRFLTASLAPAALRDGRRTRLRCWQSQDCGGSSPPLRTIFQ